MSAAMAADPRPDHTQKLTRYRMTVLFEATDDGAALAAEDRVDDLLRELKHPVIDQQLDKLL